MTAKHHAILALLCGVSLLAVSGVASAQPQPPGAPSDAPPPPPPPYPPPPPPPPPPPGSVAPSGGSSTTPTDQTTTPAGTLSEVIVTAEHRATSLQKTPLTVTTVSGAEVNQQGLNQIDQVLKNVPAVIVQGAAKGFLIAIRGLGDNLPPQNGQASVSTYYDGVYSFRAENAQVGFYDLDRVEVLEGPQNTLYGRNSSGGVVNINSTNPKLDAFGGYGTVELGDYNLVRGEGAVNVPLTDTLAFRAAFAAINRDGYLSNGHADDVADGARAKLLWKPTENFSALFGVEYTKLGGLGPGAIPAGNFSSTPWTTTDVSTAYQKFHSWKFWTSLNYQIGPGVLSILPSYQYAKGEYLGEFGGNTTHDYDPKETDQTAVDVRYASRAGDRVQWDLGYFHYNSKNVQQLIAGACAYDGTLYAPAPGFSDEGAGPPGGPCITTPYAVNRIPQVGKTATNAGYGQVTYPITQALRIIGGVRYTEDTASSQEANPFATGPAGFPAAANLNPGTVFASSSDNHFDYRAGLEYDLAPASMLYGTVSSGHRAGGFNFNNTPFGQESLTSYEVGSKNRFLGNTLQLNGDFFYYDYKDYQLAFPGFDPILNQPGILFVNLPTAHDYGVELSSEWVATPADTLSASVVYLNTELTSSNPNLAADFQGAPFPQAPKWSVRGSYSHVFDLGGYGDLTPRADVRYLTSQFVTAVAAAAANSSAESYQGSYATADLSLLYKVRDKPWSLNFYVKNVNDQAVKTGDFFGYVTVAPPRTYGVVATARF